MKTRQMTVDAMLAAVCAVLANFALGAVNVKFTLESIPVHIGALLFGPVDGMLIGTVGTLIYQLLRYGLTATTALWILPYVLCGAVVGGYARKKRFDLGKVETVALIVAAELLVTLCNTGAIYVDSHLYGYYTPTLITGVLGLRLAICVVKAAVYGLILPELVRTLKRALRWPLVPRKGKIP
jgi:ECF transporter S component (folate family)